MLSNRSVILAAISFVALGCGADLTGNWLAATPNGDGTARKIWLNLKYQDGKITGTVRRTQFFYRIADSAGGPDHFTLSAVMPDEGKERTAKFEVTATGDQLTVAEFRNNAAGTPIPAHRVPEGE